MEVLGASGTGLSIQGFTKKDPAVVHRRGFGEIPNHSFFLSDGSWHLALLYGLHISCQKKEEFHTGKKTGEGMISEQTTERKEEKKGRGSGRAVGATEILPCRPWQSHTMGESWSSIMKITRKTAMSNVSAEGCITEFLKKITNSTIANLFSFWRQSLQNSCQKGSNSTTP